MQLVSNTKYVRINRKLLNASSPDSLIIQPSRWTAGEAVIVRRPQLGRCGHLSRVLLAGPLGVGEREGVSGAGSLIVKHHAYTRRHRDRWGGVYLRHTAGFNGNKSVGCNQQTSHSGPKQINLTVGDFKLTFHRWAHRTIIMGIHSKLFN